NQFHFLIHANSTTVKTKFIGGWNRSFLSEGIRILLSTYALGINRQNARCGSLFQQNTEAKFVSKKNLLHSRTCLHYIHQNPFKAGLINNLEDWEYSSFHDYCDTKRESLVNRQLTTDLLKLNLKTFY